LRREKERELPTGKTPQKRLSFAQGGEPLQGGVEKRQFCEKRSSEGGKVGRSDFRKESLIQKEGQPGAVSREET